MAEIDNTLAAQVPQLNPATPLAEAAKIQNMQAEAQAAQYKQKQTEVGAEMRGVAPFVNTPEFPAKWGEAADRLLQSGVIDPQVHERIRNAPSPLMLKSIISQTEDPTLSFRKDEAVRDQKNQDFTHKIQLRTANRLDDPTPDGFEANPDFGKAPDAPRYRPLSGGPNDLNYLQSAAAAKAKIPRIVAPGEAVVDMASGKETYKNAGGGGTLPDETADFAAEQILLGAKGVKTGYGHGAQGPENIAKIDAAVARKAKEQGLTAADLVQRGIDLVGDTSRERTAATQEGRMTAAGIEASGAIKLGLEASEKVPRYSWVPVNKAIQAFQAGTSDPYLKAFGAANLTIVNTYARAINPTGNGNVHDKVEAATKLLNEADGPEAYKAVAAQMQKEIDLAHKSPSMARDSFRQERASRVGAANASPKAGDVRKGHKFMGGDPSDPASWQAVQ